jgi:hypothetical protein
MKVHKRTGLNNPDSTLFRKPLKENIRQKQEVLGRNNSPIFLT